MAQDLYAADRNYTKQLPPDQTPEAVLARYRAAHPEDPNATVALPGDAAYEGQAQFDPQAQAYVKDRPLTESQIKAQVEAERRLTSNGDNAARENALMQGVLLNGADELGGRAAQAGQMVTNLGRQLQGLPVEINSSDLNDAYVNTFRSQQGQFAQAHPVQSIGLNLAGGALTGGASLGAGLPAAIGTGAGYGGVAGFNSGTGSFAERLPAAATGAAFGGAAGGAVQAGSQVVAPFAQRLAGISGGIVNPGGAARSATRNYGPAAGAASRLEGVIGPEQFAERARLQALGIQPSVLDTLDNQGERLIRNAAGPAGPGADAAIRNARTRTVDLKPEVMSETRSLSGDPRTATQVREGLVDSRDTLATVQYREPYAAQVELTPEAVRAIRGPNGEAAIREAIQDELADPNFDAAVVSELESLIGADLDRIPSVSGRALDRVRIALRDTSGSLMRGERPNATRARGFASRVEGVDTALDNAPGLVDARAAYRDLSGAVDQLDNASEIFTADPVDFSRTVAAMTPTQREAAVIGLRQEILDTLGGQKAAGTGSIQRLAESDYARRNLETLLGPQEAGRYIANIEARVQQAQRAARISPNTNSQTFGRTLDDETQNAAQMIGAAVDVGQAATGNLVAIGRTIDRIRARATLSPQERDAIVQLGIGSADDLERIVQVAEMARSRGLPPPRAVRQYLTRTRNVLGSQSPVAQQLEQLLLPSRVSAEEQEQ